MLVLNEKKVKSKVQKSKFTTNFASDYFGPGKSKYNLI